MQHLGFAGPPPDWTWAIWTLGFFALLLACYPLFLREHEARRGNSEHPRGRDAQQLKLHQPEQHEPKA
jgi:hypothetical protein